MSRYHVTIVGRDAEAMADLVRRYRVLVARHTLEKQPDGHVVHAHATDEQIRSLTRDGYGVTRLEDVDQVGRQRQAEMRTAAARRAEVGTRAVDSTVGYLTVSEVEDALAALAGPPNHGWIERFALPHTTWEGRTCTALRIGRGSGGSRPGIYFLGGVHAREWGSPDILVNFARQLVAAYAIGTGIDIGKKAFTREQIRSIVDGKDLFLFPQANPDGRLHSMEQDPMWRKNRRPAPDGHTGATCIGVDINRNYDFLWDYPKHFAPTAPVQNSTHPCDAEVYIGPAPISEPETKNVVWLLDRHPSIGYFIDIHSFSEDILYNWGDDDDQSNDPAMSFRNPAFDGKRGIAHDTAYREYVPEADKAAMVRLATQMRDAIQLVRGRVYKVEQSVGLYPTAGTSDDYAFSRHLVDATKTKALSFTIEWGRATNPTPFHPPYPEMQEIIREITAALLEFCVHAG